MPDLRADTDLMQNAGSIITSASHMMDQLTSQVGRIGDNIGSQYNGQLQQQIRPILEGVGRDAADLAGQAKRTGSGLVIKAHEIERVMQEIMGNLSAALTGNPVNNSVSLAFFSGLAAISAGIGGLLHLGGFTSGSTPTTNIAPTSTPTVTPTVPAVSAQDERAQRGQQLVNEYDGKTYADGTYIAKDSYSSHPVDPPVTNEEGDRDPNIYNAVLNQFGVETNPRYDSRNNNTYCNIFVWDATRAMGAEIPHWVDSKTGELALPGATGARELNATALVGWLDQHGADHGWKAVSADVAQQYANKGAPAVVISTDPTEGHVAMVRPGNYSSTQGPAIAQAGQYNYNNKTVGYTFVDQQGKALPVAYYVHE